jgi:hypothetical protein
MSPWEVELLFARDAPDRRALARDRERHLVRRVRPGVYVRDADVDAMTVEEKHVIAVRAAVAASDREFVVSHWSAAVLQGLDALAERLGSVHATFAEPGKRGLVRMSGHVFALRPEELVEVHGILVTTVGRTVVDIAGSGSFADGVVAADSALRAGVPRQTLDLAVDLAGPRRSASRIAAVMAFADGDSGSAGESLSRVTMHGMGVHPELQRRHHDHRGYIGRSDFFFPEVEAAGEFDGRVKFLDPRYAPDGAGDALYREKVREDRMRAVTKGFARWGWPEARDARKLAPVLRAAGVPVSSRY